MKNAKEMDLEKVFPPFIQFSNKIVLPLRDFAYRGVFFPTKNMLSEDPLYKHWSLHSMKVILAYKTSQKDTLIFRYLVAC